MDVYLTPLVIEDFHITHMTKKWKELHIKFFDVNSFSMVNFLFFLTKISKQGTEINMIIKRLLLEMPGQR